jgi:hypothetical protein
MYNFERHNLFPFESSVKIVGMRVIKILGNMPLEHGGKLESEYNTGIDDQLQVHQRTITITDHAITGELQS